LIRAAFLDGEAHAAAAYWAAWRGLRARFVARDVDRVPDHLAALAAGIAFVLRGAGGGKAGSAAAQGDLYTSAEHPDQT
jgi:hypothetical protein